MTSNTLSRRVQLILVLGLIAHGMNQTIMFSVLPPIGRELDFKEIQIGGIMSVAALVFFFFSRIWGRVSDRVGRKPVMLVGLIGSSVGALCMAFLFERGLTGVWLGTGLYLAIVATRMTQSALQSATHPAASAYMADITTPARRTTGMARIGAAFSLGAILGPGIAGLLAGISLLLPVFFGSAIAAMAVILVWRLLPPSPNLQTRETNISVSYFDPRLVRFLIIGSLIFLGFSVVQQTLAFRLQDTLGLDARSTARHYGVMMMVSAGTSLLAQTVLVPRLSASPVLLLRGALPALAMSLLLLILDGGQMLTVLSMAFLGISLGLGGPGFSAAVSLAVGPEEQGAVAGIASSIPGIGFIIGPLLGAGLYQINPLLPYFVTLLALLPGCLMVLRLRDR